MTENNIQPVPEIKYQEYGQGKTIVFLHGFLESSAIWEDFAQELSAQYRILRSIYPGMEDRLYWLKNIQWSSWQKK